MEQRCRDAFRNAVHYVRDAFKENPLRFFSEKDFHWVLCRTLEELLVFHGVQESLDQLWPTSIKGHSTSLVHQEYGVVERTGEKYDVCILSPEDVAKIDGYRLTVDGDYVCPLAIAEYTTERFGERFSKKSAGIVDGDIVDKFEEDIRKLERSEARDTYALMYYRVTSSSEGRARRHIDRYRSRLSLVLKRALSKYPSVQAEVVIYNLYNGRVEVLPG